MPLFKPQASPSRVTLCSDEGGQSTPGRGEVS